MNESQVIEMFPMTYEDQIKEIMEEVDFEKIHKATVAVNWVVYSLGNKPRSIDELKEDAERMLNDVVLYSQTDEENMPYCSVSSGGFIAEIRNYKISLSFVLSSWDAVLPEEERVEISQTPIKINYELMSALDVEL